jgi:hypothetical protein
MSKLNKLSGNYKGGTGFSSSPKPTPTEEEKRNSDIEQFLKVLKDDYYNNFYSKNDLNFYKKCVEDLKNNIPPTTNFSSISNKKLQDLVFFTKAMLELNKINKNHLTQIVENVNNILNTITPKQIDLKPSPKSDGIINSLSQGYKKK